jgi:hypothetical protein
MALRLLRHFGIVSTSFCVHSFLLRGGRGHQESIESTNELLRCGNITCKSAERFVQPFLDRAFRDDPRH